MLMRKVLWQKGLNRMLRMGKLAFECLVNVLGYVEGKLVVRYACFKYCSNIKVLFVEKVQSFCIFLILKFSD